MCLAVPGKIISLSDSESPLRMAVVDFQGVRRNICVETVEDAAEGEYVIVHAGVAISKMNVEEALATIADLEAMASGSDNSGQKP